MEFAQTEKIEQMAQQIIERAQHLQQQKMQQQTQDRPVIVAIDGRCASGKTTLCSFIEQKTGYTVLHLDHFFLQLHTAAAGTAGRQCRLRAVLAAGDGPAAAGRFLLLPPLRLLGAAADGCSGGAPDLYRLCGRLLQLSSGFVERV